MIRKLLYSSFRKPIGLRLSWVAVLWHCNAGAFDRPGMFIFSDVAGLNIANFSLDGWFMVTFDLTPLRPAMAQAS